MTFIEQPYEVAGSRRGSREARRIMASGRPQAQQCDGLTAPARESRDGSTLGAARRRGEAEPSAIAADQRAVMLRKVDIALAGFEGSGMIRSS
ncbi:hypothetical protein [Bifidobacterium subtile]|nr:hypothetical protein [Bifidobacterium subtile]QOL36140.1 hypothetical protein BS3272_09745 [Bifidobacterium subtile]